MNSDSVEPSSTTLSTKVQSLELSITELISLCEKLFEEKESYKNSNQQLMRERSELQAVNDRVRGQVEAMVDRLKAMEKGS